MMMTARERANVAWKVIEHLPEEHRTPGIEEELIEAQIIAHADAVREEAAKAIPTSWLDSLLSGPSRVVGNPPEVAGEMNGIVMAFLPWLLQRANAKPPAMAREAFFAMKDRLLRRYGQAVGTDLQHIALKCWGCDGSGEHETGQTCFKCEGTGTYREFWVVLQRYRLGSRVFHRPLGKSIIRPTARPTIEGYIRHPERLQRCSRPAQLTLALLFDWSLLRALLPSLRPRWVWVWQERLTPRRCHQCGRRYLSAWSGSCCCCARCKWIQNHEVDEVPF